MKLQSTVKALALSSILLANSASAFNTDFLSASVSNTTDFGTTLDDDWKDNYVIKNKLKIKVKAQISENIRAVIALSIKEKLMNNGEWQSLDLSDNEIEKMIEEAYVEVKMVKGSPVAFIVGKQAMAFGQNVSGMAITSSSANTNMSGVSKIKEVIGMTVKMDVNFFSLFDTLETSVFESGSGDLEIGEMNNMSIRLGGDLTENLRITTSVMSRDQGQGREQSGSIGFVYKNGDWTAHTEALGIVNNNSINETKFAVNTGLIYKLSSKSKVAVEYTWIEDSVNELGLAYKIQATDNISVGPQVIYDVDSGDKKIALRLEYKKKVKASKKGATIF
jgi:hypothetical protein